jgi:hypothetical protein
VDNPAVDDALVASDAPAATTDHHNVGVGAQWVMEESEAPAAESADALPAAEETDGEE